VCVTRWVGEDRDAQRTCTDCRLHRCQVVVGSKAAAASSCRASVVDYCNRLTAENEPGIELRSYFGPFSCFLQFANHIVSSSRLQPQPQAHCHGNRALA
jgi:hypothetical protein